MKRSYLISIHSISVMCVLMVGLFIGMSARAQNAAAAFNGYNSAYLVQNGQTFYASTIGSTTPE